MPVSFTTTYTRSLAFLLGFTFRTELLRSNGYGPYPGCFNRGRGTSTKRCSFSDGSPVLTRLGSCPYNAKPKTMGVTTPLELFAIVCHYIHRRAPNIRCEPFLLRTWFFVRRSINTAIY